MGRLVTRASLTVTRRGSLAVVAGLVWLTLLLAVVYRAPSITHVSSSLTPSETEQAKLQQLVGDRATGSVLFDEASINPSFLSWTYASPQRLKGFAYVPPAGSGEAPASELVLQLQSDDGTWLDVMTVQPLSGDSRIQFNRVPPQHSNSRATNWRIVATRPTPAGSFRLGAIRPAVGTSLVATWLKRALPRSSIAFVVLLTLAAAVLVSLSRLLGNFRSEGFLRIGRSFLPSTPVRLHGWVFNSVVIAIVAAVAMPISTLDSRQFLLTLLALGLFLLPGSVVALYVRPRLDLTYVTLSVFASFLAYSVVALATRIAGAGYGTAAVLYAILISGFFIFAVTRPGGKRPTWHGPSSLALILCAAAAAAGYFSPIFNDMPVFEASYYYSRFNETFAASTWDIAAWQLDVAQPRYVANLLHTFAPFLAWIIDPNLDPIALSRDLPAQIFGFLMIVSVAAFLWEAGRRCFDPVSAVVGTIAPFLLFDNGSNVYWYSFRILNAPLLDKDFANYILLPAVGILVVLLLTSSRRPVVIATLLVLSAPAAIMTHPVLPLLECLLAAGLLAAYWHRANAARAISIVAGGALMVGATSLVVGASSTHGAIEGLARADYERSKQSDARPRYWAGHYVSRDNPSASVRFFDQSSDRAYIRPTNWFGGSHVLLSGLLLVPWLLTGWANRAQSFAMQIRPASLLAKSSLSRVPTIVAGLAGASIVLWLGTADDNLTITALAMSAALSALLGAFLAVQPLLVQSARWRAAHTRTDWALRYQVLSLLVLIVLYAAVSAVLSFDIALWRGLERLNWHLIAMLPIAWSANRLAALATGGVGGVAMRTPLLACSVLLLVGLVPALDQAVAARTHRQPVLASLGVFEGPVDRQVDRSSRNRPFDRPSSRLQIERPGWLAANDCIVAIDHRLLRQHPPMWKQLAWYGELYSEAHASITLGARFEPLWRGYTDLVQKRATPDARAFLENRGVSILLAGEADAERLAALRMTWIAGANEVAPGVLRRP